MARFLFIFGMAILVSGVAVAQERGGAQAAYLHMIGQEQDAGDLEGVLFDRLSVRKPFMLEEHRQGIARFFAFVMTVNGLNAEQAEHIEDKGIDLVRAITGDIRPLDEQVLMADLVLIADVIDFSETEHPGDGFRSSITVVVHEVLKGNAPADTLFIRQRSGLVKDETDEQAARALYPSRGERYLLLLSGGMYRFFVASRDPAAEAVPESELAQHFSIYRFYPMEGSKLLWNGYSRGDTRRAFRDVRKLHDMLAKF